LTAGSGSCVLSTHSGGEFGLSAAYEGDGPFAPSQSGSQSHAAINPSLDISGAPIVARGAPYDVTLTGLGPSGSFDVSFGDGTSQHLDFIDGAPSSLSHMYASAPGCYVVVATSGNVTSNALGVFVSESDAGVGPSCESGIGSGLVAQASAASLAGSVSATLARSTPGPMLAVSTGVFTDNPTTSSLPAAMFADVRVTGATDGVVASFIFDYPSGFPADTQLRFFDASARTWRLIRANFDVDPAQSRITVHFDHQSVPSITDIGGTFFAVVEADADARVDAPYDAILGADATPAGASIADASVADASVADASVADASAADSALADAIADSAPADTSMEEVSIVDRSSDDVIIEVARDAPSNQVRDASDDRRAAAPEAATHTPDGISDAGGGCSCRTVEGRPMSPGLFVGFAMAMAVFQRRRARR
jgi:hypothetical protein